MTGPWTRQARDAALHAARIGEHVGHRVRLSSIGRFGYFALTRLLFGLSPRVRVSVRATVAH